MLRRLLARLGRVTTGVAVIPEIDGLRFFAIGSVLLYHLNFTLTRNTSRFVTPFWNPDVAQAFGPGAAGHPLWSALEQGWFGVPLFFAISGFVLGLPFARQYQGTGPAVSLRRYFLRRLTRLEPPYLINLSLLTAVWLVVKHRPTAEVLPHALASAAYMHNILYRGQDPISSVIWSLEVEVQFYALAPLLTMVFLVRDRWLRRAMLVGAMLLVGALRPLFMELIPYPGTLLHQLQYFLVGFLLVDLYLNDWREAPTQHVAWDAAVLGAMALTLVLLERNQWVDLVTPFLILLGYVGAFRGRLFRAVVRHPVIYTIGGMCYTIYLYHVTMIIALKPWTTRLALTQGYVVNYLLQVLLVFPIVIGASAVLFLLLEKPFMRRDWPQALAAWLRAQWMEGTARDQ